MQPHEQSEDVKDPIPMQATANQIDFKALWISSGMDLDKLIEETEQLRHHIKATNVSVEAVFELANLAQAETELLADEPHKSLRHFRSSAHWVLVTARSLRALVVADAIERSQNA